LFIYIAPLIIVYEAWILLRLGMLFDTTTHIITLNYAILSNY